MKRHVCSFISQFAYFSVCESLLFTIETVPAVCESLPEEGSITRVTGRTVEGTNNLHFCVHERGKHIQIGQCCLIVEIHVNDQMMEELRAEGTLQGKFNTGPLLL